MLPQLKSESPLYSFLTHAQPSPTLEHLYPNESPRDSVHDILQDITDEAQSRREEVRKRGMQR